ncbi:DUF2490 domain-containing protein [Fulvivirgaceae bacterium BMA12]|uniref:DUF2490 domain-containing protein n=1 Tax=Agaribacillus aureus TaxID=3051825 RepID=A0ABT8LGF1_9BACT|nr:DUF2490 domain-containing protein [Fulvivirgaceae bacterium BMA12]
MKKIKLLILYFALVSWMAKLHAQETKTYMDAWFLLLNHYEISDQWSAGSEIHWRNTRFLKDKEQLLLRPFVDYRRNDKVVYTLGYTYIRSYPFSEMAIPKTKPEHNVWEQVTLKHTLHKLAIAHRYRVEHRFQGNLKQNDTNDYFVNGYSFSNRFRYRLTMKYPIHQRLFFQVFDELWIKSDQLFNNLDFGRNWFYIGFGKKVFDHGSIQIAYLYQLIKLNAFLYEKHPTVQLTFQYDVKKG